MLEYRKYKINIQNDGENLKTNTLKHMYTSMIFSIGKITVMILNLNFYDRGSVIKHPNHYKKLINSSEIAAKMFFYVEKYSFLNKHKRKSSFAAFKVH